jgi:serine/threonine protein kinase
MNEHELFTAALESDTPDERAAYLDRACGGELELRARIEALLKAHEQAGSFLAVPTVAGSVTGDAPKPLEGPGTAIGPYKLLQTIGEGGMGTVWMAEQTAPVRRTVALKVIKTGMDSKQVLARFGAERQALALMDHPNIAKVLDAGTTDAGRPYFVMELVKGVPITTYCDQNRLTPRERLELFIPVCQAVQHAHQKGVIHRDLKPSNILVGVYDGLPLPKVIDFGVAKATGQKLTDATLFTLFGAVIGTPEYMSPEQAQLDNVDIDTRSDIYSLGVLLYELLTGTTPLDRKRLKEAALLEVLRVIREEEPQRPSTRLATTEELPSIAACRGVEPRRLSGLVHGELDWIVMKALEKDRNRRYETANSLAADLRHYLDDEPVQACPPSRWYRFRKFARRNKRALVTAFMFAMAALLAVGALAVSSARIRWEASEKTKALEVAKASQQEAVANLKEALAAVDKMLTRVSEERLREIPLMEPVRRELLEDALKFYQRFLERRGNDPAIRRETALAYLRMASLHFWLGDYRKSEDTYREAFVMLDELDAGSALDASIRNELVSCHIGFSRVLRNQGKFDEGEKALRRAVAAAEGLVKEFPDTPSYRDQLVDAGNRLADAIVSSEPEAAERILRANLSLTKDTLGFSDRAQTYRYLGVLLAYQRRFPEAEDAYRKGLELFEKALAKSSSLWMKVELAETLKQLAKLVDANGRPEDAEKICRRAIPMFDEFASAFPAGPHNRWGRADLYFQHALLLQKLKRLTEAEQAYRRTVQLFDNLVEDFPTLPGYLATSVHRRLHLSQFLAEAGRDHEAQRISDDATAMISKLSASDRSQVLIMRGHFYAGLGEWDKAAADLTTAIALGSNDVLRVCCPLALAHLGAGRTNEYRSLCERMLERSESHWVVGVCTLAPDAVADRSRLVRIAEKLVAQEPTNVDFITTLGLALYRKGDLASAARRLKVSVRSGAPLHDIQASKLVLAMSYQRLGRGSEAHQLFQEVTRWVETNAEDFWAYRVGLQLLHREAEAVILYDPIFPADPFAQ